MFNKSVDNKCDDAEISVCHDATLEISHSNPTKKKAFGIVSSQTEINDENAESGFVKSIKKSPRKCPNCGGVAKYPKGDKVLCIYCGSIIDEDK